MKLGLGTAQFGMDYGVSTIAGRTSAEEVRHVLVDARACGVLVIDTAPAYGESERVLGAAGVAGFDVVTKVPAGSDAEAAEIALFRSLGLLGISRAYGLLAHSADDLIGDGGEALYRRMRELKARGAVEKVGASVYSGAQIDALLARYELDLVQMPVNVFDQRLVRDGHLAKLRAREVEVHARSAFLQGLLLMDPEKVPPHFDPWRDTLRAYRAWLAAREFTPVQAALGFVVGLPEVDAVICGVNDDAQFHELCALAAPLPAEEFAEWAQDDPALLDPSQWRLG